MHLQVTGKSLMVLIKNARMMAGLLFFLSFPGITATSPPTDPLIGFHFALEVQGQLVGYFTSVSGFGSETETIEQTVTSESGQQLVIKVPGRLKWNNITLSRGITSDQYLWTWRKKVEDGDINAARTDFSIIMIDQLLTPVARWDFTGGWPSKLTAPADPSNALSVGVETITIVHEHMQRIN